MTLKQVFIRNLKEFRKKAGLSQMRLSDYCNISHGYIGEIESGRKFPSAELIEKIADILRIEPYQLFKNSRENSQISSAKKQFSYVPYTIKREIKTKIKRHIKSQMRGQIKHHIKSQINAQIDTQINLSASEILSEISEILDKY